MLANVMIIRKKKIRAIPAFCRRATRIGYNQEYSCLSKFQKVSCSFAVIASEATQSRWAGNSSGGCPNEIALSLRSQ
jgi:hypothetical protein